MKNATIVLLLLVLVLGVGTFVFVQGKEAQNVTGRAVLPPEASGEVQQITLSMKNFNYDPQTVRVKANQPVEITLDNRVYGCLRAFTIRALEISKYSRTPDDVVTFIPTQKGTFGFSCSMGMGAGTLIVE